MEFRAVFKEKWLNIPNGLSLIRILLLPFFVYYSIIYAEAPDLRRYLIVGGLVVFATVTDFLDGFLARAFDQTTMMGRYLDPISDKTVTLTAMVLMVLYFGMPLWILILYLLREIAGVWGGTFLYFKRDLQGEPNFWGKLGVLLISIMVFWYVTVPYLSSRMPAEHWLLDPRPSVYLFALVLIVGTVAYARRYWSIVFHPAGDGE